MGDTGCFKSKKSQDLCVQLMCAPNNQSIEELKLLVDRFLQIEGEVPHNIPTLMPFISTYLEYGMTFNDRASIQKAEKYAMIGYNLCVENMIDHSKQVWFFDKYLGLSIFHGKKFLGFKELEKVEFHLGRYCSSGSSDQLTNNTLMMASNMKYELMKKNMSY